MKYFVFALILLSMPAAAETVAVKSGEHGPFTRVVLPFSSLGNWRLGRTTTGYELDAGQDEVRFDLSRAFDLIGRQRLRALWAEPASGRLQIGLGCRCHIKAEQFRGNVLVLDIHDGPADAGSPYELTLDGGNLPPLGEVPMPRPRMRPAILHSLTAPEQRYDWLAMSDLSARDGMVSTLPAMAPQFADFRAALIEELGRAATEGQVSLQPTLTDHTASSGSGDREAPLVSYSGGAPTLTLGGSSCLSNDRVDLARWGQTGEPYQALVAARTNLLREFDVVDEQSLLMAVRLHLFHGMGAEARSLLSAFSNTDQVDPVLLDLSYLVEDEAAPMNALDGQETCSGPVALWALLASPVSETGPADAKAIAKAFLELPPLRRADTARGLVTRLEVRGYSAEAAVIAETLSRSGPEAAPVIPLVEAERALRHDKPHVAADALEDKRLPKHDNDGLILRSETAFRLQEPVTDADIGLLEAALFAEAEGGSHIALTRALALAKGLNGAYAAAFDLAVADAETTRDLWKLLADQGGDDALLEAAARQTDNQIAQIPPATRGAVAQRLSDLGIPQLAGDWVKDTEQAKVLGAQIALSRRDGRAAMAELVGDDSPAASAMRISALSVLGSYDRAADLLEAEGKVAEAERMRRWSGTWDPATGNDTSDAWAKLASKSGEPVVVTDAVSLAAARESLERSASTLLAIDALLRETALD